MQGGCFVTFVTQKGIKEFTLYSQKCVLINQTGALVNRDSKPCAGFWEQDEKNWVHSKGFYSLVK